MTTIRLKTAAFVYGMLAAISITWGILSDNAGIFFHPDPLPSMFSSLLARILAGGALGIVFGLIIARVTISSVHRFEWARGLHIEFRGLFGPLCNTDIIAFAAFSAVAEEMFFRGAMQSSLGIIISSLVFGLLHIAPGRKFLPWPFQAVTMGFAFGALFWISGNLAAPIMAHLTINYQNLHFINSYDPSLQLPRSFNR